MCKNLLFFSVALQGRSLRLLRVRGRAITKINTAGRVRSTEQCFGVFYWLINIDETRMLRSVRCLIFTAAFNARAPLTNPQKTVKRQGWVESDFSCAQDIL